MGRRADNLGEVTLWLPAGVDLKPAADAIGFGDKVVYAEWLVSEVVRRTTLGKVPSDEFIPIPVRAIQTGIPARLVAKAKAVVAGVVESDQRYWWDSTTEGKGKCLGYRLTAGVSREFVRVRRQGAELCRKLAVDAADREKSQDGVLSALPAFYRELKRMADDVVVADGASIKPHPVLDHLTGVSPRWFTVCAQGRVHSPVASCPKSVRRHLRFRGSPEPLSLMDVSSSQPALLGMTVRRQFEREGRVPEDVERFVRDCTDADLYDTLSDDLWRVFGVTVGREKTKDHWMRSVYDRPENFARLMVGRAMVHRYPAFSAFIRADAARSGHGHLAKMMQRAESEVMISGVAAELVRERPDIPFVTIHDAVLTPTRFIPDVQATTERQFRLKFGTSPRLKTENLSF